MKNASQASVPRSTTLPATFRVMARVNGSCPALVGLARTQAQAVRLAKEFCAAVLKQRRSLAQQGKPSRDRIRVVLVEQWVGTLLAGEWKRLAPHRGGFVQVLTPQGPLRASRSTRSGDRVECVLLSSCTRKGGWRAKLRKANLAGPITNTADVPTDAHPGQVVKLRIGALSADGKRIQFDWVADSDVVS